MTPEDRLSVVDDLGGISEIADALGVGIHRVRRWIERREAVNCPNPVKILKQGHLYFISDWRGWYALWRVTRGCETWKRKNAENH